MSIPMTPNSTTFYVQQANGQVFLSWEIVSGATSYSVNRSIDGVSFTEIGTPVINNYLDITVSINTLYYFQIASVNSDGTSSYTPAQQVIPTLTAEMSLGQIRVLAQQTADMETSNFVTVPEWNNYINQSYFELYDILIDTYEDYFVAEPLQITTDGSALYALPNGVNYDGAPGFYKLAGVDCGLAPSNDNGWISLNKFNFIDRNKYIYPNLSVNPLGIFNLQYRIMGSNLMFIPTPQSAQILRIWYYPRLDQLLQDIDVVNGVSGWTEYIIVDAAIKALRKEESDTTLLQRQKMALIDRIQSSAMNRDAGQPDTISDTRSNQGYGNGYGGGWGGGMGGF